MWVAFIFRFTSYLIIRMFAPMMIGKCIRLHLFMTLLWILASTSTHAEVMEYPLKTGRLFIPESIKSGFKAVDLFIHLHGSPEVVEKNIRHTYPKAMHVNITLPGLSSVYRKHFQDPEIFPNLLKEVTRAVSRHVASQGITFKHIILMSFSAGFGGVRELLKQPDSVEKIDAIVMADSLYAGFTGKTTNRKLNDSHLNPFLTFAKQATEGKKQMVLSHTQLFTPEYASTRETAAYLIEKLDGTRIQERKIHPNGMIQISHFHKGNFSVLEFEGESGEEHMKHLRNIRLMMEKIQF